MLINPVDNGDIYYNGSWLARTWHKWHWTNDHVVGLGAVTTGELEVCDIMPKTIIHRAIIEFDSGAAGVTTLTASLGIDAADYDDLILAGSIEEAADGYLGDVIGELGTNISNLHGYLPSFTAKTTIKMQLICTGAGKDMTDVTGSTGRVYIETSRLP